MLTRNRMRSVSVTVASVAAAGVALGGAAANGQYTDHYPRSSATEPVRESVQMEYGTPYGDSSATIRYQDSPAGVTYARTYTVTRRSEPQVVYSAPRVEYVGPVVYARAYRPARRIVRVTTPGYHRYGHGRFIRPAHRHCYSHGHRYFRHAPRSLRRHGFRRAPGWGIGVGYGRGYDGHRRGGFSFYYND